MDITEAKLISLRDYSITYKLIIDEKIIDRNHLLDEIEEIASNDIKLILIDGSQGIGKTSILLQFATRHHNDCFTYFINPACRFTVKQDFLMQDIGSQILFYLNGEINDMTINEGIFNNLVLNLLKIHIKKGKRLYFVIDGLDQIEKADAELLKSLLENLPWGSNNFTFILSGTNESLTHIVTESALKKSKTFRIPRFSFEETCRFFGWKDNAFSQEVYDTWKGHPESFSQVKRVLESGVELEDFLIRDDIIEKNDLLEFEWRQSNIEKLDFDSELIKILSILCFDENIRSFKKVISILNYEDDRFRNQINKLSFLKLKDDDLTFISNSFRKFVIGKFKKYEKRTFTLLIKYYNEKNDISSVMNLPSLYDKNQDWLSLIDLLTVNNLALIVSNSQSFADIKKQINYGYKASTSLKKAYEGIFRFSLYRSLVNGLQKCDIRESQIQAYVSLNKLDEVFLLISNAILKEDCLKMMIAYSRECKIRGLNLDPLIIKKIELLLYEIDKNYLIDNIIDLAIGIAYFMPTLSIEIIERAAGLQTEGGSLEWLVTYIESIASDSRIDVIDDQIRILDEVGTNLNDTLFNKLSNSISFGINQIKSSDIIPKIAEVVNISDKLFLIKIWIKKNYQLHNIIEFINFGIDLILQNSSNIKPTTTNLLEILYPLPYLCDQSLILLLINRIDELILTINSPTSDNIRIQLMLIEAMSIYNINNANQRMIDLYDLIHSISDCSIKIEAYSNCWKCIQSIQIKQGFNIKDFILDETDVKKDILSSIELFLTCVADQFEELEKTFEIVTMIDYDFAIQLAQKLNTSLNRCKAIHAILTKYLETNLKYWDINKIQQGLALINIEPYYVSSIVKIFESATDTKYNGVNFKNKVVKLLPLINIDISNSLKCHLLSKVIILLLRDRELDHYIYLNYDKLILKIKGFLMKFWEKIDSPIDKIQEGYKLTSVFAESDKLFSEEFFKRTQQISDENILDNNTHIAIYNESIRLMIRVYVGIIVKNKDYSYEKLESLISQVPCKISKLRLWSELAVRVKFAGNHYISDEIVSKKITCVIEKYKLDSDKFYFYTALKSCASAIYLSQPEALKLLIGSLPIYQKENIISIVCFVIITKVHESEPFNDKKGSKIFNYQDAIDFLKLMDMLETDSELFHNIRHLCNIGKYFPDNFTREQKSDIQQRLYLLISIKLPNSKTGVKHDGYIIACKACILSFNVNHINDRLKDFEALGLEVLNIDNVADRSLIYLILAKECSIKKKRNDFINQSFDEADQILSVKQKINYYEIALEEASSFSLDLFKSKILQIQSDINKLDESDKFLIYKNLIEIAYKNDNKLAKRLIGSLDSDPGRKQFVEPINEYYNKLELEKNVLEDYSQIGKIKNRKMMNSIIYRMIGELNSDKRESRNLEQSISLLHTASKYSFFNSLPLLEFFIQNYIKNSSSNENKILDFYDSTYTNAKLCFNLICSVSNKNDRSILHSSVESENSFFAHYGMRDLAIDFIEKNVRTSNSKDIYIIDSYFSYGDLPFIKSLSGWTNEANITILTSPEANKDFNKSQFKAAWNEISSEEFPPSCFISASNIIGKSPIHDRWILFPDRNKGLRIGSSINAIGGKKLCEISTLTSVEVEILNDTVLLPFAKQRIRDFDEQTIKYETFEF